MNPWTTESAYFAHWLGKQKEASILPNQVNAAAGMLDRLDTGDIISVMFNAKGDVAMKALDLLKHRYEEEQYWLSESNATQYPGDEDDAIDWG